MTWREHIVFDTNALARKPEVLSMMPNDYMAIVPRLVIEELQSLLLKKSNDFQFCSNIREALSIIDTLPDNLFIAELESMIYYHQVIGMTGSVIGRMLTDDAIVAIALQYSLVSPILVTNDRGMREKAIRVNIRTMRLNEFLRELI